MLTSLELVPAAEGQRALIATGDRDEHIRISRFPNGHNIDRFLFGSTKYVAATGGYVQLSNRLKAEKVGLC